LKIRADLFRISSNGMTADGNKAEPEQQQVQHVIQTDAPVNLTGNTKTVGTMPAEIVTYSTAQEMAQTVSHQCGTCKFFDGEEFVKVIRLADSPAAPMEQRAAVNNIRAGLLQTQNARLGEMHSGQDGDMDVEQALNACGFCKALTEHYTEPVGVHPLSCCPGDVKSPAAPHGFYQPKNVTAARVAGSNYDKVMNLAAGKLVTTK